MKGKAQNRHDTVKWKIKRKNHLGDKCHNKDCGVCHPHKKYSKRVGKMMNKKQKIYNSNDRKNTRGTEIE